MFRRKVTSPDGRRWTLGYFNSRREIADLASPLSLGTELETAPSDRR